MLTVTEARTTILFAAQSLLAEKSLHKTETVFLLESCGRVLAQDVIAAVNVPPCDNSAMDGYAVHAADCAAGVSIPVVGIIYAGAMPEVLQPATAQRIFTGAPVPPGADAVVIQEDVVIKKNIGLEGEAIILNAGIAAKTGENIRRAGEDISIGDILFPVGHRLRAQDIGLLASIGIDQVQVARPLHVGLLCTGDELLEPGDAPQVGKIYNSNRYLLSALLRDLGCEVIDAGIVKDDLAATEIALQKLAAAADVVISTGGVSVGDADYVKQAVLSQGKLDVWKIAVKPGKPLAFGSVRTPVCTTPFFGLPGNPVSAFVTFLLFVRPFLQTLQGAAVQDLRQLPARAGFDWLRAGKREEYLRVTLQQEGDVLIARALPNQGSGVLSSVCRADALLRVPVGATFAVGDGVECLFF